jgi:hypothetical protein
MVCSVELFISQIEGESARGRPSNASFAYLLQSRKDVLLNTVLFKVRAYAGNDLVDDLTVRLGLFWGFRVQRQTRCFTLLL